MSEDFLIFIWKYGLFDRTGMITDNGEEIQVIAMGEHNTNAGPDFLNARIKIGDTTWAGNVELHVQSSDWFNHHHQTDKAYDNVILQVVHHYNQPVMRINGEIIPTVELRYEEDLFKNYKKILDHAGLMPCEEKIKRIDPFLLECWISSLVIERLQQKTEYISRLLFQLKNNWEEAFYISLARTFGFSLNCIPFEMLAKSVSLLSLSRHKNCLLQLEAMLMGQAGFLDEARLFSGYYSDLRKEYLHLKHKYNLKPIEKHLWKFLRLRPVNFPTIRIAQFAALLNKTDGLFSQVLACSDMKDLQQYFDLRASSYWDMHYTFETVSPMKIKKLGTDAFNTIVINTVVPFLFLYGRMNDCEDLKEKALEWLNHIPPEKNRITKHWKQFNMEPSSAFHSQGILQLYNAYCNRKRCLACSIGTNIITKGIR
jgi:hypothetical protein